MATHEQLARSGYSIHPTQAQLLHLAELLKEAEEELQSSSTDEYCALPESVSSALNLIQQCRDLLPAIPPPSLPGSNPETDSDGDE